jgi:hypothetical protein
VAISYESRLSGLPEDSQKHWDLPASSAYRGVEEKAYDEGLACAAVGDSKP